MIDELDLMFQHNLKITFRCHLDYKRASKFYKSLRILPKAFNTALERGFIMTSLEI